MARAVLKRLGMKRFLFLALAACGGGSHAPAGPRVVEPKLVPTVAAQSWYFSSASCAQGPFELTIPVGNEKYGDAIELALRTPRRVSIHAEVVANGNSLQTIDDTFDASGRVGGSADNARCVADARERLALVRGQRSGTPGGSATTPGAPGGPATMAPPPAVATQATLEVEPRTDIVGTAILQLRVPAGATSIRIRWWSTEPNDLDGVRFGLSHVVWRPNVDVAVYEAFIADQQRARIVEEQRQADMRARQEAARAANAEPPRPVKVKAYVEATPAEIEAARRAEEQRRQGEQRAEEQRRLHAEAEQRAAEQRKQFCDNHPADRGCWGPGGLKVKLELDARVAEGAQYCAQHHEDARCWTDADWRRIHEADDARVLAAMSVTSKPSGPPPAPLAETVPPRLSVHAEWRPGYWQWIDATWVWLAGMWRVPESDIATNQTTAAPVAPPPQQAETPTAQPVRTAVWIAGFWQWNGSTYVWISGSWQLPPGASVQWRAPTWQPRAGMHVLVPGAWVRIGIGGSR